MGLPYTQILEDPGSHRGSCTGKNLTRLFGEAVSAAEDQGTSSQPIPFLSHKNLAASESGNQSGAHFMVPSARWEAEKLNVKETAQHEAMPRQNQEQGSADRRSARGQMSVQHCKGQLETGQGHILSIKCMAWIC